MNFLQPPSQKIPPANFGNSRPALQGDEGWFTDFQVSGSPRPGATPITSGGLLEYLQILNRRKWTLLIIAVASTIAANLITRMQAPVYRSRSLVEIESLNENFLNMRNLTPTSENQNSQSPEYNIRTQIEVLQSRPVVERALQKSNLEKRILAAGKKHSSAVTSLFGKREVEPRSKEEAARLEHQTAMNIALNSLKVRPEPNSRILSISFDSTDATIAADFANSLTTAFTEVNLENRWRTTQNTSEWLSRQLQDVKVKLTQSQDELQKYAHAENLTFMSETSPTGDTTANERLKEMEAELSRAQSERVAKQSAYEQVNNAAIDSLPEIETALEKDRARILARTRNEYDIALRREQLVNRNYAAVTNLVATQSEKVSHYMLLKHEFDATRQLYESLVQRVKEADLASAMKASDVHVIEFALPPQIPYRPVQMVNMAFGLLSGTFLGIVYVIQRARAYHGIQEPGDATLELNVPELGVIPATTLAASQYRRFLSNSASLGKKRAELTSWQRSPSMVAEAFRFTMASLLLPSKNGELPKVIAFSSAHANEGKTTVVSNMAIALASIDRRVLLIDGDIRKRRLHKIFEVDNSRGLKEALEGGTTVSVQHTEIPNLWVLPSGQGSNETLFFGSRLRELLDRLKTQFDMILIDTPPLLQISDARLICHDADAVVMVVAQHTLREVAIQAKQRLMDDGSNLIGTILNKWDPRTNVTGYGYGPYTQYKEYQQTGAV
jgi:succinoglycan biosynthesis transport protein ExoP